MASVLSPADQPQVRIEEDTQLLYQPSNSARGNRHIVLAGPLYFHKTTRSLIDLEGNFFCNSTFTVELTRMRCGRRQHRSSFCVARCRPWSRVGTSWICWTCWTGGRRGGRSVERMTLRPHLLMCGRTRPPSFARHDGLLEIVKEHILVFPSIGTRALPNVRHGIGQHVRVCAKLVWRVILQTESSVEGPATWINSPLVFVS